MAQTMPADRMTTNRYDDQRVEIRQIKETRRAFQTTEFFVLLATVAAVIVVGYAHKDSLDVARIWTLVTALSSAYMLSRGIAKAGSRDAYRTDRS
ncbi:MAG: hypothetical protein JWM05_511 [Acidimicrobiales bacterium]|nr:hypothetical protein [Acidimicrobiales bacterium]